MIKTQQQENGLQLLPIELTHILALTTLPYHHRDPFDRLLIAQASIETMAFVSVDSKIMDYPITIIH